MSAVDFLISRLAVATVEFLIFGFLVAGLLAVFRSITPRWRCRIWLLAMCKPFVTVFTGFLGGLIPVPVVVTRSVLGDMMFPNASEGGLVSDGGWVATLFTIFAYSWIIITALMLIRVWLQAVAGRQLVDESLEKGYRIKPSAVNRLDPSLVVPPDVDIVVTPEDAGPATLGILRPTVIIPESLLPWVIQHRDPTKEECERFCQVLRHEIGHASNRDGRVSLAAMIMLSFFWFHPIAHWAYRRVRLNNELRCDEAVINSGVKPDRYVNTLMNVVADRFSRKGLASSILGDSSPAGILKHRLNYLLSGPRTSRFRRPVPAYFTLGLMILIMPNFLGTSVVADYLDIRLADGEVRRISVDDWPIYAGSAEIITPGADAILLKAFPDGVPNGISPHGTMLLGNTMLANAELVGPKVPESASPQIEPLSEDTEVLANVDEELVPEEQGEKDDAPKKRKSGGRGWDPGSITNPHTTDPILPARSSSR